MWYFRSPQIIFGEDSLDFLESLDMEKVVIITDKVLTKLGLPSLVKEHISDAIFHTIDEIPEEPSFSDIDSHSRLPESFNPDTIIAIGGGSVIDSAKILYFKIMRPDLDYYSLTPLEPLNIKGKMRFIAIPTTVGTGSECSWAAVVSDREHHRKLELASPEIIPDYSILDPRMVGDLPDRLLKSTVTDALTHAIEGATSSWRNPFSEALAMEAISLITHNVKLALTDRKNLEARSMLQISASMGGLSFSNSQIGLAHALGHAFGSLFRKPHGFSVGLFLEPVIDFNSDSVANIYEKLNLSFSGEFRKETLKESIASLLKFLDAPAVISDFGITREEFISRREELIEKSLESTGIIGNPREVGRSDIEKIIEKIGR